MALLSRLNIVSGQRLDVPDLARIESALAADFLQTTKHFFTSNQSYIGKGFTISPAIIGTAANQVTVDFTNAAVWHSNSADVNSSGLYIGPASGATKNVPISNAPNVSNYIYCDFTNFTGANAPRAFWSVTANNNQGGEFIANIDTARFLDVTFASTTSAGSVPTTAFMIAIVKIDGSGVVESLTDARNLFFRLGTGGTSPNPAATYSWSEGRTENSNTSTSALTDPFYGADKGIDSLSSWMKAVMESIREIKGTPFWYESSPATFADIIFDASASFIAGSGKIQHGGAGALSWTSDMFVKAVNGRLSLQIPQSQSPASLADGEVLYLDIARNYLFNNGSTTYTFNSSSSTILGTGAGAFQTALDPISGGTKQVFIGDWIKLATDNGSFWAQITDYSINSGSSFVGASIGTAIPSNANAVEIFGGLNNYPGNTAALVQASYHQGYFTNGTATSVNPGNLKKANRSALELKSRHYWLAVRDDNGASPARIYIRGKGELEQGEETDISDGTSDDVLSFIGSTGETDTTPNYSNHAGSSLRAGLATALENQLLWFSSGNITWNATLNQLSFADDIFIKPANESWIYQIPASESPLSLTAADRFIYATLDRTGASLTLTTGGGNLVEDASSIPLSSSALYNVKLFWRDANSVVYGPDNTRWDDGDTVVIGGSAGLVATPSSTSFIQEVPTGTVDGVNANFTVSTSPTDGDQLIVLVNGLLQRQTTDYTFSDPTITFTTPPPLGSNVFVYYNTDVDLFTQEVPSGVINGINTNFTLTTDPTNTNNLMVFLDGQMQEEITDWTLSSTTLTFTTPPAAGQTLDVFYIPLATDFKNEVVGGTINGINTAFTVSQDPQNNSLYLTLDGLYQRPTIDYTLTANAITMTVAPVPTQKLLAFYQGTPVIGGQPTLQTAYDNGATIIVNNTFGAITIQDSGSNPINGKLMSIQGDLEVTGTIDPIAVEFTQPTTSELAAMGNRSIYFDGGELKVKDGSGNIVQITAAGSVNGGGGGADSGLLEDIFNNTGSTINAGSVVTINASGEMELADVTSFSDIAVIGICLSTVIDGAQADVRIGGLVTGNLFTSFTAGDVIYLAKTPGSSTATQPELGVGGFVAGDNVVLIGKVIQQGANKNLILSPNIIGEV